MDRRRTPVLDLRASRAKPVRASEHRWPQPGRRTPVPARLRYGQAADTGMDRRRTPVLDLRASRAKPVRASEHRWPQPGRRTPVPARLRYGQAADAGMDRRRTPVLDLRASRAKPVRASEHRWPQPGRRTPVPARLRYGQAADAGARLASEWGEARASKRVPVAVAGTNGHHRSTSPMIGSTEEMMATPSAIRPFCIRWGRVWRLMKLGARTCTRYGTDVPSLTR